MFGSAVIFIFVTVAYFATRDTSETLSISKFFAYSTVLLLFSSYPISRLSVSFDNERGRQIVKSLAVSIFSGALFTVLQVAGWMELIEAGLNIENRSGSFLVVLSVLHVLHIVAVVLVSTVSMYRVIAKLSNPISTLVYYSNPYQRLVLQMLTQAWVFLHVVWMLIYLTFVTFAG
jgi:cytochrome c oxidase subunit 3